MPSLFGNLENDKKRSCRKIQITQIEPLFNLIFAKDHKETAVLSEVFHELSTAPFRPERKRVLANIKLNKALSYFPTTSFIVLSIYL